MAGGENIVGERESPKETTSAPTSSSYGVCRRCGTPLSFAKESHSLWILGVVLLVIGFPVLVGGVLIPNTDVTILGFSILIVGLISVANRGKPAKFHETELLCKDCVVKEKTERADRLLSELPKEAKEEIVSGLEKYLRREGRYDAIKGKVVTIDNLDKLLTDEFLDSLEKARIADVSGRYEDAAKEYEYLEMWTQAGRVRKEASSQTVKQVKVDINELLDKLRTGGLTVPYKCPSCGASIIVDRNSRVEGLKFCSYCGTTLDTNTLGDVLSAALK